MVVLAGNSGLPKHTNKNVNIMRVPGLLRVVKQHLFHIANVTGNLCVGIASVSCPMLAGYMNFRSCPQKQPDFPRTAARYCRPKHVHMRAPTGAEAPGPRPVRRAAGSWHLVLLRRAGVRRVGGGMTAGS